MHSIDDTINELSYAIEYLRAYKAMQETGNCNTCAVRGCEYMPAWGDLVRYNCPHYVMRGPEWYRDKKDE